MKNAELRELHLAIGAEEGIYLVVRVPIKEVTVDRLDELAGAALIYVGEIYPTAMVMGLPALHQPASEIALRAPCSVVLCHSNWS